MSGSGRDSIYPDSMFRNLAITSLVTQHETVPSDSFRYGKTFTFSREHLVYIRWIHVKNPGYCRIYVDNCLQDEKILMGQRNHRTETFPIDGKCYSEAYHIEPAVSQAPLRMDITIMTDKRFHFGKAW